MKPYVRGKNIAFREVCLEDAEFLLQLRTDPDLSKHLSPTPNDVEAQRKYIINYKTSLTDFYFIIIDLQHKPLGTVRIYDIRDNSFCWGSWILAKPIPNGAAVESALLIYDFAFFSLHYTASHFDVRKENSKVIDFHTRFGASIVRDDDLNVYFTYDREAYLAIRPKYDRFLP
jgi:RimJ/RimL family protein N-acetyltransferase